MKVIEPRSSVLTRLCRGERGQSLVELAVALPLFLLILLGVMDFGKAFNYWITETQVSAEGARRAAVGRDANAGALQTYVRNQIKIKELRDNATIKVCFPDGGLKTVGHPVKIIVSYSYNWLPILERFGGVASITLRDSSTMRLEKALPTWTQSSGCP
jgi:hypothetical protein